MTTTTFRELRQAERDYPGILKQLRKLNKDATQPFKPTRETTGRTILLATLSTSLCKSKKQNLIGF